MANLLLSTKLLIPQKRSHLVARPRLFALLDQGLNKKLILVSAPAGFGKTTLVTEWLHQRGPAKRTKEVALQTVAAGDQAEQEAIYREAAAIRTGIALARGDYPCVLELAQQALVQLPAGDLQRRGEVTLHLGIAAASNGDPLGAERAFADAAHLGMAAGDLRTALLAIVNQGARLFGRGRLHEAAERYHEVLRLAQERCIQQMPIVAFAYDSLGELYLEWNDLESASFHIQEAISRGEQGKMPRMLVSTRTHALARARELNLL